MMIEAGLWHVLNKTFMTIISSSFNNILIELRIYYSMYNRIIIDPETISIKNYDL